MFLDKLWQAIGSIFIGVFNSAKRAWKKQSTEVQDALLHGAGIVEAINTNLDKTPDFVITLLQGRFPKLTKESLHAGLAKVSAALKIGEDINNADLETLIKNLQEYLGGLEGHLWAAISHSIASIFAIVTAPPETKFAQISLLIEYIYHSIIKKD